MGVFKSGKVVVVLSGRFAGRKAIVVKASDDAKGDRKYGHAIVAGVDRYPRKVVASMSKKTLEKRTRVRPFVKAYNYTHIMPTRYSVDFDLKKVFPEDMLAANKVEATRKSAKALFEDKFRNIAKADKKAGSTQYFFSKLRF